MSNVKTLSRPRRPFNHGLLFSYGQILPTRFHLSATITTTTHLRIVSPVKISANEKPVDVAGDRPEVEDSPDDLPNEDSYHRP